MYFNKRSNLLLIFKASNYFTERCDKHNKHEPKTNSLVPGRMSDMSIKGPEFWIRAWWCRETPVQKFCGFTDWLNSVSVTGTAALSSPVASKEINKLLRSFRGFQKPLYEWQLCCCQCVVTCLSVWCLPCLQWGAGHVGCQYGALVLEEDPSLECLCFGCSCYTETKKQKHIY